MTTAGVVKEHATMCNGRRPSQFQRPSGVSASWVPVRAVRTIAQLKSLPSPGRIGTADDEGLRLLLQQRRLQPGEVIVDVEVFAVVDFQRQLLGALRDVDGDDGGE